MCVVAMHGGDDEGIGGERDWGGGDWVGGEGDWVYGEGDWVDILHSLFAFYCYLKILFKNGVH